MNDKLEIDHGGNAFPTEGGSDSGLYPDPGMSLRDWFAGQAIVGMGTWMPMPAVGIPSLNSPETLRARADWAYSQADALIAARKAGLKEVVDNDLPF